MNNTVERLLEQVDKALDDYTRPCDGCNQPHPLPIEQKMKIHDQMSRLLVATYDGKEEVTEEEIATFGDSIKLSLDIAYSKQKETPKT